MDVVDLDKLATIIESPSVTEARRQRFAELFAAPVEHVARADRTGPTAANVTVGPWGAPALPGD